MGTIIFTILFFLAGIASYVVVRKLGDKLIQPLRYMPWVFFGLSFFILVLGSYVIVPAGSVGVRVTLGKVDDAVLQSGFNFVSPISSVDMLNTRTQIYTMSSRHQEGQVDGNDAISITMKDQSSPEIDISVNFRLNATQAANVYRNIGADYVEKIVRPDIRSVIPRIATLFNSTDLYDNTERTRFEALCKNQLDSLLARRGLVLEDVRLREVLPAKVVQDAINAKIAAQQEALQMEFKKQKALQAAEILKIESRGIDSSQAIIAHSLTSEYLQYKYIEAISELAHSNNTTFIFSPLDQKLAPILNMK